MSFKQSLFLSGLLLTPLTQRSRASSQPEAPPSSSAEPHVFTAVTVSMDPTAIRASITARWALCTNHMGEEKRNRQMWDRSQWRPREPRQHQSITANTITLDILLLTAELRSSLTAAALPLIYQQHPLEVTRSQLWVSRNTDKSFQQANTHMGRCGWTLDLCLYNH